MPEKTSVEIDLTMDGDFHAVRHRSVQEQRRDRERERANEATEKQRIADEKAKAKKRRAVVDAAKHLPSTGSYDASIVISDDEEPLSGPALQKLDKSSSSTLTSKTPTALAKPVQARFRMVLPEPFDEDTVQTSTPNRTPAPARSILEPRIRASPDSKLKSSSTAHWRDSPLPSIRQRVSEADPTVEPTRQAVRSSMSVGNGRVVTSPGVNIDTHNGLYLLGPRGGTDTVAVSASISTPDRREETPLENLGHTREADVNVISPGQASSDGELVLEDSYLGSVKIAKDSQKRRRHEGAPKTSQLRRREGGSNDSVRKLSMSQGIVESHMFPTPALTPASLADPSDDLTQIPDEEGDVPLHVDDIERLLVKHRELLHQQQEALVSNSLARAREQHKAFKGPTRDKTLQNPFKHLFAQKLTTITSISAKEGKETELLMRTSRVFGKPSKKVHPRLIVVRTFESNAKRVPKVKSIGRLGSSRDLLARNVQNLTHMPWYPENEIDSDDKLKKERYEELETRYHDDIKVRSKRRRMHAIANTWLREVKKVMVVLGIECNDIIYYMLHNDVNEKPATGTLIPRMEVLWYDRAERCPGCEIEDDSRDCRSHGWKSIASAVRRPPTERRLAMAGLLCEVFYRVATFNLWHVVSEMDAAVKLHQEYLTQAKRINDVSSNDLETFCYACGQYSCLVHGAYIHSDDSIVNDDSMSDNSVHSRDIGSGEKLSSNNDGKAEVSTEDEVVLDDPELTANARNHAALPLLQKSTEEHNCGVFCVALDVPLVGILGLQPDGAVIGTARDEMLDIQPPPGYDDSMTCDSGSCFWNAHERDQSEFDSLSDTFRKHGCKSLFDSETDQELYDNLLPMSLSSKRGPCELALAFPDMTCMGLFYRMLCSLRITAHSEETATNDQHRHDSASPDLSNDKDLDHRIVFTPCSHQGVCLSKVCTCATGKISCEASCGCSVNCARRFKGCHCRDGRRRVCFEDLRCECWVANRECDPSLCGTCGVQDVLDPVNRGNEELSFHCRNNRIQLGVPKRTIMGISEVHGWGLYAGENIGKFDFVSEYKGELISILEGDRRGAVYHNLGLEYLFILSKDQELDGSRISNKARFINNSSLTKNINVLAKKLLCNGVTRIMLYASRDIVAGEELFYDYGYHKEKRATFTEKPDPLKRITLAPTARTKLDLPAPSITSTSLPVHSESAVSPAPDESIFEPDEEPVLPTSEPDSEFGLPEDISEESDSEAEAESADESDALQRDHNSEAVSLRRQSSKDGLAAKRDPRKDLYQLPDSPNDRPRKQLRLTLSQPKQPSLPDSDSDTPLGRRTVSQTRSRDTNLSQEHLTIHPKRVPPEQRKRKINAGDRRLGGEIQRKAAVVRKRRLEAERKAAENSQNASLAANKRKRNDGEEPSSSQRPILKLTQPKTQETAHPSFAQTPSTVPPRKNTTRSPNLSSAFASASMSESSRSASPYKRPATDSVAQNSRFESSSSKRPAPSGFGSESTQSIPHSSPPGAQTSGSTKGQRKKHLLGCGPT